MTPTLIHLASGNANKVREIQRMAADAGLPVQFAATANPPDVVEDTGTFLGNARKKARAFQAVLPPGSWVLADDSGICVDALKGAPGVESAYFAGPQHDGRANLMKMVEVMKGIPDDRRGAYFICVLVLMSPEGEYVFEGRCHGNLLREPSGWNGFGYDPIFVPHGFSSTFGDLDASVKNRISHRARAFDHMARTLRRV